jgi:hypothetical protein
VHCDKAFEASFLPVDQGEPARWQNVFDAPFLIQVESDVVPIFRFEPDADFDWGPDRRCALVGRRGARLRLGVGGPGGGKVFFVQ